MCHDIGLEHDGEVPLEWWREPLMSTVCATGGVPPSREYDRGRSKWHLLPAHLPRTPIIPRNAKGESKKEAIGKAGKQS